jgi:hypothetical protein
MFIRDAVEMNTVGTQRVLDLLSGMKQLEVNLNKIHTYHSRFIHEGVAENLGYSSKTPPFYQNDLAMRNTVTGGKPIAVYLRHKCF